MIFAAWSEAALQISRRGATRAPPEERRAFLVDRAQRIICADGHGKLAARGYDGWEFQPVVPAEDLHAGPAGIDDDRPGGGFLVRHDGNRLLL